MTIDKVYITNVIHKLVEDIKSKEMDYGMNGLKVQMSFGLTEAQILLDALLKTERPEQTRWISVSERLPELTIDISDFGRKEKKSKLVYITCKRLNEVYTCPLPCYLHSNGHWYLDKPSLQEWVNLDDYDDGTDEPIRAEVIAWMPLPEPCKVRCQNMTAIKDMEMPKYCNYWNAETRKQTECPIYKSCKHRTSNIDVKPTNCPLVEIVTCKDCEFYVTDDGNPYCADTGNLIDKDYFCAGAERKE